MKRSVPKLIRSSTIALSLNVLLKGQLKYLNKYYDVIGISGENKSLEVVREREKVRTINVPMERHIAPIKDLISLFKMINVLKKEKPTIVHSITPKAGLLSMTAAYIAGVPIRMHTFTGLIWPTKTGFIRHLLIFMDKVLCKMATNVYPEGQGVKNDLTAYKITKKPLKIIANGNVNGIDLVHFNPANISQEEKSKLKDTLDIQQDDFIFLFIGRLVGDKGINELIEAFIDMQKSHPHIPFKLLLVGPFEHELDPLNPKTIKSIEENDKIISVGFQYDVRPYLAISDAFVFPSYREGFPNVVLQACAYELPSIVTNINGSNEIIKEGVNGTIINVKDAVALKNAMLQFINSPEKGIEMGKNARDLVIKNFDQNYVWECLKQEYDSLIQSL